MLTIRSITPADQNAARTLVLNGLAEHIGPLSPYRNSDVEDICSIYVEAGHLFVVAEIHKQLVGTGGVVFNGEGQGQLVRLSVHQDWRRQGIGRAIVNFLIGQCRQRNLCALTVETNLDWSAATSLYRACGFVEFHRDSESLLLRLAL